MGLLHAEVVGIGDHRRTGRDQVRPDLHRRSMDSRVRAIDLKSGKVLWKHLVDAPAVSMPAIYVYKGKEYVVFAAGGNAILTPRVTDQIIAFALPQNSG